MEKLIKSDNGQWTLIKSDDPEKGAPWTEVHFSDGSKKGFPYRHMAASHLASKDYIPQGKAEGSVQHFQHMREPEKTAVVVHHQRFDPDAKIMTPPTRRSTDIK